MPESQFLDPNILRKKGQIYFEPIQLNSYNGSVKDELKRYSAESLKAVFYDMAYIRIFENALSDIKTKGGFSGIDCVCHSPFHLSMGQEAAAVGQAFLLDKNDYIFGSHRSHGEILAKGFSAIRKMTDGELTEIMEKANGGRTLKGVKTLDGFAELPVQKQAEKFFVYGILSEILVKDSGFSRGLSGSMHAFFTPFGIYPNNAVVGGSASLALGSALFKKVNKKGGVVIANIGDGAMGCGPVWEAMSFATMDQFDKLWEEGYRGGLPLMFNFFDNQYAMNAQTVGETMGYEILARVGAGVTPNGMFTERVDGFNPLAVIDAYSRKLPIMRKGGGVCMLDVLTYRFTGHNVADFSTYRSTAEVEAWEEIDPLKTYPQELIKAGVMKMGEQDEIYSEISGEFKEIFALAADMEKSPRMDIYQLDGLMYSNGFKESFGGEKSEIMPKENFGRIKEIQGKDRIKKSAKPAVNFSDGVFEAVLDKFYEDSSFICYGEECRDWGKATGVYRGLKEGLPYHRLFNTCISESAIVGSAAGYALSGGRVMADLMFIDFLGRAGDEVFNQLPKWQAMTAGSLKMPLVVKVKVGAKYGAQHSQDWSAFLMHVPGLKVVYPATPYDAKGLMNSALNGTDPTVFLESQRLSDAEEIFTPVPEEKYFIEIGKPIKRTDGEDVTVLSVGATLYRAYDAVCELQKEGINAELFDARSILPFDYAEIVESVKKTGRILIVSDECEICSVISEMASKITSKAFDYLKKPPKTFGAKNWITPAFEFEKEYFPQKESIKCEILKLMKK